MEEKIPWAIKNSKGRINHHSLFVTTSYQLCKDWSTSTSTHHQLLSFSLRACNLHVTQVNTFNPFCPVGGATGHQKLSSFEKKLSSSEISKFQKGGAYYNTKDHPQIRTQLSPKLQKQQVQLCLFKVGSSNQKQCSSHSKDNVQATKNS